MDKIHYTENRIRPMQSHLGESPRNAFIKNYMSHIDGLCDYNPSTSWNSMYSGKRELGEFPNCKKCLKKYLTKVYFKRYDGVVADVTYANKKVKVVVENCGVVELEFDFIKDAEEFLRKEGFIEYLK